MKRGTAGGLVVGVVLLAAGGAYVARARLHAPVAKPRIYVTNEEAGTVTVIDGATDLVLATIPVGKRPRGVQLSRDGARAYVALSGSPRAGPNQKDDDVGPADKSADGIGVIDTATNTLERVVISGSDPEQFTLGNDENTLYVANEDAAEVAVIDITTNRIAHAIPVGEEPEGVTLGPGGKTVWATSERDGKVYVIDVATNVVTATIDVGSSARPRVVAFSHRGDRGYVTLENAGAVAIVDVATRKVERTVKLAGLNVRPMGAVFSPDDQTVYVTTGRGHALLLLDAADGSVRSRLEVGERPWGIGLTRDGTKVYTANGTSNDVSVIDVAKNVVVATIKVGARPWGVAVYP